MLIAQDPRVVQFVNSVPLWQVCDLSLPQGQGDKRLLREAVICYSNRVLYSQAGMLLGMAHSTRAVKRAIQFGTRISKQFKYVLGLTCKQAQSCGSDTFVLSSSEDDEK